MKFYKIDDQIVISDKALTVGKELTANTVDAAFEKHVPVIEQCGDTVTVKVGSVEHPSMPETLHRMDCPGNGNGIPDPLSEARE